MNGQEQTLPEPQTALNILSEATAQLNANRAVHTQIALALSSLQDLINRSASMVKIDNSEGK